MGFDHTTILFSPSEVIVGATTLSGSSPFGGTVLGYTEEGVDLGMDQEWVEVRGHESGKALLDLRYCGSDASIVVLLKQWDTNTLARAFPGGLTAVGGTSGKRLVQLPGTLQLGSSGRANAGVLLIAPLDLTNNPVVLARVALPSLGAQAKLAWKLRDSTMLPLVWRAVEDTSIASSSSKYNSRTLFVGDRTDQTI